MAARGRGPARPRGRRRSSPGRPGRGNRVATFALDGRCGSPRRPTGPRSPRSWPPPSPGWSPYHDERPRWAGAPGRRRGPPELSSATNERRSRNGHEFEPQGDRPRRHPRAGLGRRSPPGPASTPGSWAAARSSRARAARRGYPGDAGLHRRVRRSPRGSRRTASLTGARRRGRRVHGVRVSDRGPRRRQHRAAVGPQRILADDWEAEYDALRKGGPLYLRRWAST